MSKNSNRSSNGNGGGGFPVFAGIMLGMVIGLAIAGAIAWFVLKKNPVPTPPAKETPQASRPAATPEKSVIGKPAGTNSAPATGEGKARFEFYKELTDKPDSHTAKKPERQAPAPSKPVTVTKLPDSTAVYFLQEGAYSNAEDAEKVKVKLALFGMMANVQPANIPDKGVWYRVRLGPYKNPGDMNEALATLKLNGLTAVPIKTQ